ncbi:MAG: hypothetical protein Q4G49_04325 [Paracoccus sp. (in: a-proteobacteria)]|nr:hypothetical protein [Paracoccus sp. (in: a-proteobacteria)]
MADYYTQFSCLLEVGTPDNAAAALELYSDFCAWNAAEDPPSDGCLLSIEPEHGGSTLWLTGRYRCGMNVSHPWRNTHGQHRKTHSQPAA